MSHRFEQPGRANESGSPAAVLEHYSPQDLRNIQVALAPHDLAVITFSGPNGQLFTALCGAHYNRHHNPQRADIVRMLEETTRFCETADPQSAIHLTEGSVPDLTPDADPLFLLQHHMRHEKAAMVGIAKNRDIEARIGDGDDIGRAQNFAETYGCSVEDWIMLNLFRECTSYNPAHGLSFKEHITQTVTNRYGESLGKLMRYLRGGFDFSFEALSWRYKEITGRDFTAEERDFCFDQVVRPLDVPPPPYLRTPMQNLALTDTDNRHDFMRKTCRLFWHRGYSIITYFGPPHFKTLLDTAMTLRDLTEARTSSARSTLVPEYAYAEWAAIVPPKTPLSIGTLLLGAGH